MAFSALGLVLGAALTENMTNTSQRTTIELLGGIVGTTPMGLALVAVLAQQAATGGTTSAPVTDGTRPTETQVPDVTTAGSVGEAAALLITRGLTAAGTEAVISGETMDTILGSFPGVGSIVTTGTAVTILVSAGLQVPDVTSHTVSDAEAVLGQFGFRYEVQASPTLGPVGIVTSQDPAGGTFASVGDAVTLYANQAAEGSARARRAHTTAARSD